MYAYVNYPEPHFTIHWNAQCSEIRKNRKPGQRLVEIQVANLGQVLSDFISGKYRFASDPSANDLWLDISLDTPEQEEGLVHVIQALVGRRYSPLADAPVRRHCGRPDQCR